MPSWHFQPTPQGEVLFTLVSLHPWHFYFEITPIQLRVISGDVWVSFNALLKPRFSLTPSACHTTFFRVTAPLCESTNWVPTATEQRHKNLVWQSGTALLSETPFLAKEEVVMQKGNVSTLNQCCLPRGHGSNWKRHGLRYQYKSWADLLLSWGLHIC